MKIVCRLASVLMISIALAAPLLGQWLNYPTPGVPRWPNGSPNLEAPTPRTAEGNRPYSKGIKTVGAVCDRATFG